jgi:serine/threonine protein kinase
MVADRKHRERNAWRTDVTDRVAGGGNVDDYAGRVLADRYRLPLPPADEYELTETRAFDTYSGQEVLLRQVPLPEVVEAEVLDADGLPDGFTARDGAPRGPGPRTARGASAARASRTAPAATRRPADPAVRRAVEAAQAAARVPDHPRLDQVFDVFTEGGSLWIASELVSARPLAALLAERPLTPYRAAEIASDIVLALRVLHGHGWVHRNITARTVLVCDDGRVLLTGLAVGAAEEALCGYDPVPPQEGEDADASGGSRPMSAADGGAGDVGRGAGPAAPGGARHGGSAVDAEAARRAAIEARAAGPLPPPGSDTAGGAGAPAAFGPRTPQSSGDIRAARAGAIAAYRAGTRAAARVQEAQETRQDARRVLPGARPPAAGETRAGGADDVRYGSAPDGEHRTHPAPPGQITDPYGVRATAWSGTAARPGPGGNAPAGPGRTAPPAAGTLPAGALPGPARRVTGPGAPAPGPKPSEADGAAPSPARWDDPAAGTPARRVPATALAAERARQARMTVVGPVTERWAPEQAVPVHENWQLAAPIGPATDLWALGALLFRAVQGHGPYPEESTAELVQMVCAEPPAFAEECGPLRPVVESLLRQDPTERIDFEELGGWLRSLVRSAPEPDAGAHVVAAPPADPARLPVVRRRGELVRRRRAGLPAHHGRHKRGSQKARSPRSLGRSLLLLILLVLVAAVAYAMLFMPKSEGSGRDGAPGGDRTRAAGGASPAPARESTGKGAGSEPTQSARSADTRTTGVGVPEGFTLRSDSAGFRIAVATGWSRTPENDRGQVVYSHGDFELIVVPGRDTAARFGSDPMTYQRERESELQGYRDSSWATSSGLRTIQVGGRTMAEGQFTWTGPDGRELFVRNLAILLDGRYHVLQVRGPETQRDQVNKLYEQASVTYRFTG